MSLDRKKNDQEVLVKFNNQISSRNIHDTDAPDGIKNAVYQITTNLHRRVMLKFNLEDLYDELEKFFDKDFYPLKKGLSKTEEEEFERNINHLVNYMYTLYIQDFYYMASHKTKEERLLLLIRDPYFLHVNHRGGEKTVWINREVKTGYTPLHSATKGHLQIANELLDKVSKMVGGRSTKGFLAFVTQRDLLQSSPLDHAARSGNLKMVELILQAIIDAYGSDVAGLKAFLFKKGTEGFNALSTACINEHTEVVKLLLKTIKPILPEADFHAYVNYLPDEGYFPPIYRASKKKYYDIAQILLEHGATITPQKTVEYMNKNGLIDPKWIALLHQYSGKIMPAVTPSTLTRKRKKQDQGSEVRTHRFFETPPEVRTQTSTPDDKKPKLGFK